jgi:UDP-4-amino-4-deoxy-L-arabinose-oxoglutarate aminotransferase
MRNDFLPFSRPSISEADIHTVAEVLRSGYLTSGPQTAAFEKAFAEYVGCPEAVTISNATAGMHVLLKALDIQPGDEVITPSQTWVSTVNLIVLAGAKPVFVDVDRDTLMVSPEALRAAITPRTRLIIPVHFAGSSLDMDPILALCREQGIALIEDTAHAMGTQYKGRPVGRIGTSIFSFHPLKNITAGEGGMVCSDDPDLLKRIRQLKYHGLGRDEFDAQTQGRTPRMEVMEPGYSYNMLDTAAALGRNQLARLDVIIRKRTQLAMVYRERLADVEELLPLAEVPYCTRHAWQLFSVRLDIDKTGITRNDFMSELKDRNVGTGLHFRAVHLHKYYAETLDLPRGALPNSDWNSERICSLPLFFDMTEDDVDHVVDAIKDVLSP